MHAEDTTYHPAVIATKPDSAPFIHMVMSYSHSPVFILERNMSAKRAETDPAAAAIVVVTAARAQTAAEALEEIAKVLPGLNPYHPTQRMNVPKT
jgi:hypothetical protein